MIKESVWTDGKIEQLRCDWIAGKSCGIIAAEHDVSRNAVIGKVHRLGLNLKYPRLNNPPRRLKESRPKQMYLPRPRLPANLPGQPKPTRPERIWLQREAQRERQALAEKTPPADFLCIALLDLESHHCRYPHGERENITFCGRPKEIKSFCGYHAQIVYQPPEMRHAA
jgi:GcrA cell cycle regulator